MPSIRRSALTFLACFASTLSALAATPITGVVTNRTTNRPAGGDDVVLIRLAQGMQESTHTKTDARGRFTLDVPDEGIHLVRVTHDKANYFRPAPPGTDSVEIDVFNSAPHVKGVTTEAQVMRIQTDAGGNSLRVVQNFFIKNESKPQLTQFSDQPFDFYLPDGAVVEGSAALAPGGMPVQAAPVPLADKGHYTFIFPIRPGETRFQITYRVPYSGKLALTPRIGSTTDTIAIMLPKSMTFTAEPTAPFNAVSDEVNAQTFVARNVSPQQPLGFTLSGQGQLPRDTQNPDQGSQSGPAGSAEGAVVPATENKLPGKGLDNPLDPEGNRDPWGKYKWWILAGLGLLLAAAAGVLLRKPSPALAGANTPSAAPPETQQERLLQVLKEELFALEKDRLQQRVTDADYQESKAALELILRRVLGQHVAPSEVS